MRDEKKSKSSAYCGVNFYWLSSFIFQWPKAERLKISAPQMRPLLAWSISLDIRYPVPLTFECKKEGLPITKKNYSCIPEGLTRLAFHLVQKGFFGLGILFEKFLSLARRGQNLGIAVRFLPEQKLQLATTPLPEALDTNHHVSHVCTRYVCLVEPNVF